MLFKHGTRVRFPVGSQVSERGHFRSGFLWPRAKKTTDFGARRAFPVCLRAKRLGTNSNALAFARAESEVRAEDFLEGGFFGGVVFGFRNFFKHLRLLYPLAQGFEPHGGVSLTQQDS